MPNHLDLLSALRPLIEGLKKENDLHIRDFVIAKVTDPEVAKDLGDRMNKISSILNDLGEADTQEKMAKALKRAITHLNGEEE